jgi:uncharacterized protein DUF4349
VRELCNPRVRLCLWWRSSLLPLLHPPHAAPLVLLIVSHTHKVHDSRTPARIGMHTDLAARLKNSRETEQRFRTILQQRTGNVAEVLQVEEETARVRGDIERLEAEQKAFEHRVDFATVELQLTAEYRAQLNPPAASLSTRVHNAFVAGYRDTSETVLGIVPFFAEYGPALLIWLMTLVFPVIVVWRRYRKALAAV